LSTIDNISHMWHFKIYQFELFMSRVNQSATQDEPTYYHLHLNSTLIPCLLIQVVLFKTKMYTTSHVNMGIIVIIVVHLWIVNVKWRQKLAGITSAQKQCMNLTPKWPRPFFYQNLLKTIVSTTFIHGKSRKKNSKNNRLICIL